MTNANWGGPRAGTPGYQQHQQGQPRHPEAQDPAWHGQPPVMRAEPPMRAPAAPQPQVQQHYAPQPQQQAQPQAYQPAPAYAAPPQQQYAPQPQAAYAQPHPQPAYARPAQMEHSYYAEPPLTQPAPQPEAYYAAAPDTGARRGGVASVMNGLGAILSVALIGGLAVWGYKLAMRDVTEVPVVAALEGPMRIQPENPGGEDAEHQGLAVNNVAAEGVAEGPAHQLVLAPPAETLDENDAPAVAVSRIEATPTAEAGDSRPVLGTAPLEASISADEVEAAALAMVDQIAGAATPLSGESADLSMTPEAEARTLNAALVRPDVPGVAVSPRPVPRPAGLVTRAAAQPSTDALLAATREATSEVSPGDIPAGTRLVQLGAYDTEDVARAEWDQIAGRFGEYLDGKARVIEQAQSGGKTFYRLRAMGFDDLSDARRFCSALMAGNAACIPVVTR